MRILQVIPYFAPAWAFGGPPVTVYNLARGLANRGHKVTVLTTDALSANKRQDRVQEYDGLEVHYLPNLSNRLAWHYQLFLPLGTWRWLKRNYRGFDVVHLHMFRTYQGIAIWRITDERSPPYVFSAHGSVPRLVRMRPAKKAFDVTVGDRLLEKAARLIAVSESEKKQYEAAGVDSKRVSVIYNGIDTGAFQQLPPKGRFASDFGVVGKEVITYLGRLNARKGLDSVMEAFSLLRRRRRDVILFLLGPDDGYRAPLERLAKRLSCRGSVFFQGQVDMSVKLGALVDSDVVVYPGSSEVFGLVPFEALLCGCPVIVANDSGCGEIIEKAGAGITVPCEDSTALATAIESVLDREVDISSMVSRGRRFIIDSLNCETASRLTESVYQEVVSGN